MKPIFRRRKKGRREHKEGRQNADRCILGIAWGTVVLFLWLIGYMGYFLIVPREEVINNPYNARLDGFARSVERGKILSSDKTVLAVTETGEDGSERRLYPYGSLFSHGVGYSTRGNTGLEALGNYYLLTCHLNPVQQLQSRLAGKKLPGDQIVTTFDTELQQAAGEALGDKKGAVVALEPATGRVLAMVSKPDFDANTVEEDWEAIAAEDGQARLVNRAVQGLYPPGSVFKIVTLLAYIREHPLDYGEYRFECTGSFQCEDYSIRCYHGTAHGSQTLAQAFANSCNGAFASLGLELDKKGMADTAEGLLFNREQPVALPYSQSRFLMGEDAGIWEVLQTSIGQGLTQMTPMHGAMMTAAVANGGVLMAPLFMDRVENEAGETVKTFPPEVYGSLMSREEAEILGHMMETAVAEGTGSALRTQAYTAAGKTGSAQFETGKETHAWFTGYAPADNPRIAVTVIVEEGGSGGQAAAPIARRLFDIYLSR
ncbi:MAG: penicillin-binding protein 2 [Hungatella sp.]|nr:penicillin-binding protein 2 [Hungatella sp.]